MDVSARKVLAVVPARGGSKGVPGKNLAAVGGVPLVVRAVRACLAARHVTEVVVSTDDDGIAAVALGAGAEVVVRPRELSHDTASSEAALLHALDAQEHDPDVVLLVQCTSPFLTAEDVDGVAQAVLEGADTAVTVAPFHGFVWRDGTTATRAHTARGGEGAAFAARGGDGSAVTAAGGEGAAFAARGGESTAVTATGGDGSAFTAAGGESSALTAAGGEASATTAAGREAPAPTAAGREARVPAAPGRESSAFSAPRGASAFAAPGPGAPAAAHGVNHDKSTRPRRQDRPQDLLETGAAYAMAVPGFRRHLHRFFGQTALVRTDPARVLEIDDPHDLARARALAPLLDRGSRPGPGDVDAVVMDFDGTQTDDRVLVDADGRESVCVHRGDGLGIAALRDAGIPLLTLSTERNPVVAARARKLRIPVLHGIDRKDLALKEWCEERSLDPARVLYVGNDVNDLPCFALAGWPVAVADAHDSVRAAARAVTTRPGGSGAIREIAAWLLGPSLNTPEPPHPAPPTPLTTHTP